MIIPCEVLHYLTLIYYLLGVDMVKKGYVYLTTNNINGKKYIGMTTRNNPNYLGSGKLIKRAIKKYGRENFSVSILEHANAFEELCELEKYYIEKYNAIERDDFYNIHEGGNGGNTMKGYTLAQKQRYAKNMREIITDLYRDNYEIRERISKSVKATFDKNNSREKISNTLKKKYEENPDLREKMSKKMKEVAAKPEVKKKQRESIRRFWENNDDRRKELSIKYSGKGNPNYGNTISDELKEVLAKARREVTKNTTYACDENWNIIKTFDTKREALEFLNLKGHSQLNRAIRNKTMYKGYYWKAER